MKKLFFVIVFTIGVFLMPRKIIKEIQDFSDTPSSTDDTSKKITPNINNKTVTTVHNIQNTDKTSLTKPSSNTPKSVRLFDSNDSIDILKLLKQGGINKEELLQASMNHIRQKMKCIIENKCEDINSNRPYNDPNNTQAQRELNNALSVYSILAEQGTDLSTGLRESEFTNLLKIDNYQTRFSALSIMALQEGSDSLLSTFDTAKSFTGDTAADYITLVSVKKLIKKENINNARIEVINHYLKNSSKHTISLVGKSLLNVDLKKEEVLPMLSAFCSRNLSKDTDSGKMLYLKFEKLANRFNTHLPCK